MKTSTRILGGLLPSLFITSASLASDVSTALRDSHVSLDLRYRLEHVEQDTNKDALASTLKTRLGIQTGSAYGWQGIVEVDNVTVVGNDLYNSTRNNRPEYAVVADPRGTDINQALLRYSGAGGLQLDLGRQRINQLNQRFIGGVGWRQNEQTFTGYRLQQRWENGLYVDLSRLHNVHRIFGPKGSAAEQPGELYNALGGIRGDAYHVALFYHDFDFSRWAPRSSRTYGAQLEYAGQYTSTLSWKLQLVAARQESQHANPTDATHGYHLIALDNSYQQNSLRVGMERLAGDGVTAFQTPLATLHAFQGFTDLFLVTPADGVRDYFMRVGAPWHGVKLSLGAHYFTSDQNRSKYGHELNMSVSQPLNERLSLLYKGAYYDASSYGVNTRKLWFMVSYRL
ncbi:hypothetical protein ACR0ST_11640 [Aliidiomarina sp. Khilg15.8]